MKLLQKVRHHVFETQCGQHTKRCRLYSTFALSNLNGLFNNFYIVSIVKECCA